MAKGGKGGGLVNGPSKTGNPSGKGRGNNAPRSGSSSGGGFGGGFVSAGAAPGMATPSVAELAQEKARSESLGKLQQVKDCARAIRTARENLADSDAYEVELDIRAKLTLRQCELLTQVLSAPETAASKAIRGAS